MRIGSILENIGNEKRITITPDIVKKYMSMGFEICLPENYGSHIGIKDKEYLEFGVKFIKDENEIINNSDIIVQLGMLSDEKSLLLNKNQTLIGSLNPYINKEKLENLVKKKNKFIFIGAFTQLNIIPFAMQSLGLSEVGGGYLFLPTAVGIAIGAVLSGLLSKDKVELGISCICGFFISIFFLLLYFFSSSLSITVIVLGLLGVFGGAYLIPFDSFLQVSTPKEKRGQVIAAGSFFSFIGVLMASFALYFISEKMGFSAASGFFWMALLSLISNIITLGRLSGLFFSFFCK